MCNNQKTNATYNEEKRRFKWTTCLKQSTRFSILESWDLSWSFQNTQSNLAVPIFAISWFFEARSDGLLAIISQENARLWRRIIFILDATHVFTIEVFQKTWRLLFLRIPQHSGGWNTSRSEENSPTPNRLNQPLSWCLDINEKLDLDKLV